MIAQILARGRRGLASTSRTATILGESRRLEIGACCVRAGLAILLLPALATVLVVGGVGAANVGTVTVAAKATGGPEGSPKREVSP